MPTSNNNLTVQDIVTALYDLSLEDLQRVNDTLRSCFDLKRSQKQRSIFPGDVIEFTSKWGQTIKGKVIRHMRKNTLVQANDGVRWRVGTNLLRRSDAS